MRKLIWVIFILGVFLYINPTPILSNVNITISDLMFFISFLLIVMMRLYNNNPPLIILNKNYKGIWIILLFLIIGTLSSAMFSENPLSSVSNLIQYIFIFFVLLNVIEYLINKKLKNVINICIVSIIPIIILVAIVLFSYFGIYTGLDSTIISLNGRYRGFEGIATAFGSKIAMYYAIVLFLLSYSKKTVTKLFLAIIAILFMYVSILSGSFGSVLIIFLITTLFLLYGFRQKWIPRLLAILFIASTVAIYISITVFNNIKVFNYLPSILGERYMIHGNFGSAEARNELNVVGLNFFFQNPIIGVGYSQFRYYNDLGASVHNLFISAAVELGIFGLIGVLLYTVLPVIYSFKMSKYSKSNRSLHLVSKFLLIYSLVRLFNGFKAQEYVDREPWIIILVIFVCYANFKILKDNVKN